MHSFSAFQRANSAASARALLEHMEQERSVARAVDMLQADWLSVEARKMAGIARHTHTVEAMFAPADLARDVRRELLDPAVRAADLMETIQRSLMPQRPVGLGEFIDAVSEAQRAALRGPTLSEIGRLVELQFDTSVPWLRDVIRRATLGEGRSRRVGVATAPRLANEPHPAMPAPKPDPIRTFSATSPLLPPPRVVGSSLIQLRTVEALDSRQRSLITHQHVSTVEEALRSFIDVSMTTEFGSQWAEERMPPQLLFKWRKRQSESIAPMPRLIDYADFGEYAITITGNAEVWGRVFAPVFRDKSVIHAQLGELNRYRRESAHCRPLPGDLIVTLHYAAVALLRQFDPEAIGALDTTLSFWV